MRMGWMVCVVMAVVSMVAAPQSGSTPAQGIDQYLGTWTGTWAGSDGGNSGELELAIEKSKEGAPAGRIKAAGGESGHSATFKTLSFKGNQMTARYDYPLGDGGEIVMEATFDAGTAKGTWQLQAPGGGSDALARGTWTVTKK